MRDIRQEFERIYNDNIDRIYRFVLIKVNSKELAEDLTSETFIKTWNVFKSAKKKDSLLNPRAFCYQIARNLIIDYYRSKSKLVSVSLDFPIADPKNRIIEMAEINSDMKMVMNAISNIKNDYQDVIIWRYIDELSIEEIASLLDKSEEATRVMIHRAMDSLRKVIEN